MCVIVYKPAEVELSKEDLRNMWIANPDGAGLAYYTKVEGEEKLMICIERGFMSYKSLRKRVKALNTKQLVLHFRRKTHGKIEPLMCHPFPILPATAPEHKQTIMCVQKCLFHNGILSKFGGAEFSDTYDFTVNVLVNCTQETQMKLLDATTSKFILMDQEVVHFIGYFQTFKGMSVSNTIFDYRQPIAKPVQQAIAYNSKDMSKNHGWSHTDNDWNGRAWKRRGYWETDYKVDYHAACYPKKVEEQRIIDAIQKRHDEEDQKWEEIRKKDEKRRREDQIDWENWREEYGYGWDD